MSLLGSLFLLAGSVLWGDSPYLYWSVEAGENDPSFTYAAVGVTSDGSILSGVYLSMLSEGGPVTVAAADGATEPTYAWLGTYADSKYGFFVEGRNWDSEDKVWRVVGRSDPTSYDALVAEKHIATGSSIASPDFTPWKESIPEPSGGMLVLFGLCALSLRRKRRA